MVEKHSSPPPIVQVEDNDNTDNPMCTEWHNLNPPDQKYQTRLHRILFSTWDWIQPQSRIENIDNLTCLPWHQNSLDIKIDTGSKTQAAYTHSITARAHSNNTRILSFYSDGSLLNVLNGAAGAGVIGLREESLPSKNHTT